MSLFEDRFCPNLDRDRAFPEPPENEYACQECGKFIDMPGHCYDCWAADQNQEREEEMP